MCRWSQEHKSGQASHRRSATLLAPWPKHLKRFLTTRPMGGQRPWEASMDLRCLFFTYSPKLSWGCCDRTSNCVSMCTWSSLVDQLEIYAGCIQNPSQHALKTHDGLFSGFTSKFFQDPLLAYTQDLCPNELIVNFEIH